MTNLIESTARDTEVCNVGLDYETLYNNIVVRTLTKSTTNEIFKLLTEGIKRLHQQSNAQKVSAQQATKLKIILPERLAISFSPPKRASTPVVEPDQTALIAKVKDLSEQKQHLQESKNENHSQLATD